MRLDLLDRIGDWNPQLFRELKGKLQLRNVAIAVSVAFLGQLLLLLYCYSLLPHEQGYSTYMGSDFKFSSRFCVGVADSYGSFTCNIDPVTKSIAINWPIWWQEVFRISNWILPCLMVFAGTFVLAFDMVQEERRGTLNFIRMSPRSAKNILVGKLLGVPALVYLIAALLIPLHLWSGSQAGAPPLFVASFYLLLGVASFILYAMTLLIASLGGAHASIVGAAGTSLLLVPIALGSVPFFMVWNGTTNWSDYFTYFMWDRRGDLSLPWFFLQLSHNFWVSHGFTLVNGIAIGLWFWGALIRRFDRPTSTIVSKKQSYLAIAYLEVLMLGFCIGEATESQDGFYNEYGGQLLGILYAFNVVCFIAAIAAISPHRQALLDWARYRRESRRQKSRGIWLHPALIRDLIWGGNSPAPIAIALNLAIASTIALPGILFLLPERIGFFKAFLALAFSVCQVSILAVVAQQLLLMRTSKRVLWAGTTLAALVMLPPIVLIILSVNPSHYPFPWLFSIFAPFGAVMASMHRTLFALCCHVAILGLLSVRLKQQLQKAGESEFKALLTGDRPSVMTNGLG